jgi:hypothetical protein
MFGWVLPARPNLREDVAVVEAQEAVTNTTTGPPQLNIIRHARIARDPVSSLSLYPRWALSLGCTVCVCSWAALPLSIMVVRRTVSHFVVRSGLSGSGLPFPLFDPLAELRKGKLGTIGVLVYRTLICEALKTAVMLGISGCRVAVCRYMGLKYFGWGSY